mmetsp:Transcript_9442/g.32430  ORF Transcript_9442/g.32430 Transcript_9442/m.32430 type:complete len:550 (+) Transcript_9442:73-1722(+)
MPARAPREHVGARRPAGAPQDAPLRRASSAPPRAARRRPAPPGHGDPRRAERGGPDGVRRLRVALGAPLHAEPPRVRQRPRVLRHGLGPGRVQRRDGRGRGAGHRRLPLRQRLLLLLLHGREPRAGAPAVRRRRRRAHGGRLRLTERRRPRRRAAGLLPDPGGDGARRPEPALLPVQPAAPLRDVVPAEGARSGDGDGAQREPAGHRRGLHRRRLHAAAGLLRGHHGELRRGARARRRRVPAAAAEPADGVRGGRAGKGLRERRRVRDGPRPHLPRGPAGSHAGRRLPRDERGLRRVHRRDQRRLRVRRRVAAARGLPGVGADPRGRGLPGGHRRGRRRARRLRRRVADVQADDVVVFGHGSELHLHARRRRGLRRGPAERVGGCRALDSGRGDRTRAAHQRGISGGSVAPGGRERGRGDAAAQREPAVCSIGPALPDARGLRRQLRAYGRHAAPRVRLLAERLRRRLGPRGPAPRRGPGPHARRAALHPPRRRHPRRRPAAHVAALRRVRLLLPVDVRAPPLRGGPGRGRGPESEPEPALAGCGWGIY